MRVRPAFVALLLIAACACRSDDEKRLEAERVESVRSSNEAHGSPELRWDTGGKHHTTIIRIQPFGSTSPDEIRAAMLREMPNYDAGKEQMEMEGWTHVGFRDRDSGIEMTKPVSELRGIAAVEADWAAAKRAKQEEEERKQQAAPAQQ
ncbi:hypothetical protein LXT21_44470 [Myxococcus sp. K38C18041901]|uniref:hypothetical protein n=1 Tax=Myxococcus guangdongensis TaxID=2906760 RepID=UPI0020A72E8A|nr:hypothetical protein [Myxococcus guangdongensis]MCP3065846.1 hypothetical protein [Myxococcus guangdongensis]